MLLKYHLYKYNINIVVLFKYPVYYKAIWFSIRVEVEVTIFLLQLKQKYSTVVAYDQGHRESATRRPEQYTYRKIQNVHKSIKIN